MNDGPLIVQSDKTLLLEVDHEQADAARKAIAPFAELERSPEHVHTYRLTPLGLWTHQLVVAAAGSVGWSAMSAARSINTRTFRQLESPPELLSRVMATVRFVSWGVIPVGSVLAGVLATTAGSIEALAIYCLLVVASPLVLFLSPVRGRRELRPSAAPAEVAR